MTTALATRELITEVIRLGRFNPFAVSIEITSSQHKLSIVCNKSSISIGFKNSAEKQPGLYILAEQTIEDFDFDLFAAKLRAICK